MALTSRRRRGQGAGYDSGGPTKKKGRGAPGRDTAPEHSGVGLRSVLLLWMLVCDLEAAMNLLGQECCGFLEVSSRADADGSVQWRQVPW